MDKSAIYARKSSVSDDKQALSIESQLHEDNEIAKRNSLTVVQTLSESQSAQNPGRPVFNQMINMIKRGQIDTIIVWKVDRLSRNAVDAGVLIHLMHTGKLKRIVACDQIISDTNNDQFLLTILLGAAKLTNDNNAETVKRGMKTKAEKGWYPFPAMNGYLNTPDMTKGFKIIIADPNRFSIVRKMWDLILTGAYTIPQINNIANNEWGYRNRKDKPISRSQMYIMFSHPFYYGDYLYNGVWYKGKHEPMVTKEEWDKVQSIIHRSTVPHYKGHDFLFKDILKCGVCRFSITGTRKIKNYKRTGRVVTYDYYRCTHKNRIIDCVEKPVKANDLKEQFIDILQDIELDEDFKVWAEKFYTELDDHESKDVTDINNNLESTIKQIDLQLSELLDLKLTQSITKEEFEKKRHTLLADKENYQKKLNKKDDWMTGSNDAIDKACDIRAKFEKKKDMEKKVLIRSIGSNFFLKGGLVSPDLLKPYLAISEVKKDSIAYIGKFELDDYRFLSPQTLALARQNPTWLPGEDLVRQAHHKLTGSSSFH